ncbi:S-layer homology domain-containing protein [Sporosarcina gallistercoris]|uniref:S-layer homology domain-containing protein n=1 Tax=Sporosarcina gallistercoris TaxID=2762245 RepID=UPI003D26F78E
MAQQSYKKFVASAATATLVASALIPVASANVTTSAFTDVPASYKDAVDFVVSKNIASGKTETQFGISQQITRGDAAIMIAAAAGLNDKDAPSAGFSDVPTRGALAVNSLKAAGVINGKTATKFGFTDNITRGEAAIMLQKAFKLEGGDTKNSFTDVKDSYDAAVDALVANKVTNGINKTQFGTGNPIKRGDFAKFVYALKDQINIYSLDVKELKANSTTEFEVKLAEALPADEDVAKLLKVKVVLKDGKVVMPEATKVTLSTDRKTVTVEHKNNDLAGLAGTLTVNGKNLDFDYASTVGVESVKATNAKTLTVTFNKGLSVDEQKAVALTAKRDGSSVLVKFDKFDGKTATIVRTNGADFAKGTYVLDVTGLGEAMTATVVVDEKAVTKVEITNENLLDGTSKAKLGFGLKDQYGEDVKFSTSDVTYTGYNKTKSSNVAIQYNSTDGYYVDTASNEKAFEEGDIVTVSLVHDKTGKSVAKDLKVVAGAQLNSVTLGAIKLPDNKTLLTEDLKDVMVPYTAYNQYGTEMKLVNDGNIKVIVTDETVLDPASVKFKTDADGKNYINIDAFKKAGMTNVILLNKVTGETTTLALEVNEKAGVAYNVQLAEGSVDAPAGGVKYVDLVVTDKYGNKVEPKDYAVANKFTVATSNETVATAAIVTTPSDDNYGKLKITTVGAEKNRTAKITVTLNATGKSSVVDVNVAEAATPFDLTISKDSKHAKSIVETGTTTVKFDVFDQYNNKYGATQAGYTVSYKLADAKQNEFVQLTDAEGSVEKAKVSVKGLKAGSATVVAELKNSTNEVVDTVEVPFTVVANSSTKFTYAVKDIPTLYKTGAGADNVLQAAEVAGNDYSEEIKVDAVAADGSLVSLPSTAILNVASASSDASVIKKDGKWYVTGSNSALTEDKTVALTLNVKTDEGVKTITKNVVVSGQKAMVKELSLMDKPAASGYDTAKEVESITTSTYEGAITFTGTQSIWSVDQFGVATDYVVANGTTTASASAFNGLKMTSDDTFTTGANTVTVTDVNGDTVAPAGSTYKLSIIDTATGALLEVPVKVTNEKMQSDAFASKADLAAATIDPITVAWNTNDSTTKTDVLTAVEAAVNAKLPKGSVVASFADAPTFTSAGKEATNYVFSLAITGTDSSTSTGTKTVTVTVTP